MIELDNNLLGDTEEKKNNNDSFNLIEGELNSTESIDKELEFQDQNSYEFIINMGFDQKMAKKVFILFQPKDINEAIDYLTKEDNVYHHDFIERKGKINECFICGEPPENHIDYIPPEEPRKSIISSIRKSLNLPSSNLNIDKVEKSGDNNVIELIDNNDYKDDESDNQSNIKNEEKENNAIICELCADELAEGDIENNSLLCQHMFCSECYFEYFKNKIGNNKVGKITCMKYKCPVELDPEFIEEHLSSDDALLQKYKKYKLKSDLYKDPNVKFCPIRDCDSYAKKENDNKYVTCQVGHKFCFQCLKPWHGSKKCSEEIDSDFKKWKKNKMVKRCPNCKMWTEKNLGCNHMTCVECKYQWCWICQGKYTYHHFEVGGGCAGLQFSDIMDNCCCLYLYKFLVIFYQSLFLIFLYSTYCFTKILKIYDDYRYDSCFLTKIMWLIWFFGSVGNIGIFVPLGIVLCFVCLILNCLNLREKILSCILKDV